LTGSKFDVINFSEESQENADFENLHLMGVLFKRIQYWLTKELYRFPIKKIKIGL
jgi:hypothetical protein